MTTFSWLHGTNGNPCIVCGSHVDPCIRVWDSDVKGFVPLPEGKCTPCSNDRFVGRGRGTQYRPPASQSPDRSAA